MALASEGASGNGYCDDLLPKMPTLLTSPVLKCHISPVLTPKLSPLLGFVAAPEGECDKKEDMNVLPLPAVSECYEAPTNKSIVESVARLSDVEFIEDVDPSHADTQASEQLRMLMEAVEELWCDRSVRFGGTCAEVLKKKNGSKLTILSRADIVPAQDSHPASALIGFIVYRITPAEKKLNISRVAVMPEFRGQGYGRLFMEWCLRQPGVSKLTLTATARALGFYRAFGFRKVDTWHQGGTAHPDEEPTDEQVYMEFRPVNSKSKKKNKARR